MLFRSDRKSTRLNSSHLVISYAVFCLKKKKKSQLDGRPRKSRWARGAPPQRAARRRTAQTGSAACHSGPHLRRALSQGCFFFFNDTATTEIYTLSLHDALPIWVEVMTGSRSPAPASPRTNWWPH